MNFNKYQQAFFARVKETADSITLEAGAGTGKTTTIVEAAGFVDPSAATTYVAFNKNIAVELGGRLPSNVRAKTLNSAGHGAMMRNGQVDLKADKVRLIYRRFGYKPELEPAVVRMVALAKTNPSTLANFDEIIDDFEIIIESWQLQEAVEYATNVFAASNADMRCIDFDDQVFFPAIGRVPVYKNDILFVDERQDLNASQIELCRRMLRPGGRIFAVGDSRQSIYGFRGANLAAMDALVARFDAVQMPLSICYRCGRKIVELAQTIVPTLEYAPDAIDGEISDISERKVMDIVRSDDMILCRTNAPLVSMALKLISNGIKAQIRGRDIGKGITNLVKKIQNRYFGVERLDQFHKSMTEYVMAEVEKLEAANKFGPAATLLDQMETIVALSGGITYVYELLYRVETIFTDTVEGVTLSSVHRAKGTEADRVMILHPDLLPHPSAKSNAQKLQEQNLKYVAITRARKHLMWVR